MPTTFATNSNDTLEFTIKYHSSSLGTILVDPPQDFEVPKTVKDIKLASALLIDLLDQLSETSDHDLVTRACNIAIQNVETACMHGVKGYHLNRILNQKRDAEKSND